MTVRIDLGDAINSRPLSWFQLRIALLCATVLLLESFDSGVLGYVAPMLSREWHLPPGALGPAFAVGFFGQLLGAIVAGPLADRVGRKGVLIAAVIGFGLGALATTQATSLDLLLAIRFATGLGLGAALPNAVALTTEYSPTARRSMMLVLVFCGVTLGAVAAGLAAAWLLPRYGWSSVFWVGGLLPLALTPVLLGGLAESPYLLALRGTRDGAIAAILRRISPDRATAAGGHFVVDEEHASGFSVANLFRHGRAAATLLLWLIVFMNNLEIYVFASWLPSLAVASGLSEEASVLTGVAMTAGGFVGTLMMGWAARPFSDRADDGGHLRRRRLLRRPAGDDRRPSLADGRSGDRLRFLPRRRPDRRQRADRLSAPDLYPRDGARLGPRFRAGRIDLRPPRRGLGHIARLVEPLDFPLGRDAGALRRGCGPLARRAGKDADSAAAGAVPSSQPE
jgi:AAHS family 4-hydroxybenzoate transporter-like MFS transporter